MLRRLLIELIILMGCLSVFPALVLAAVHLEGTLGPVLTILARGMVSAGGPWWSSPWLWAMFFAPYVLVQGIRLALRLTGRTIDRSWIFFGGCLVCAGIAAIMLGKALDLLVFMYALGDLPAALDQFVRMEGWNLALGITSMLMAVYSLSLFVMHRSGRAEAQGNLSRSRKPRDGHSMPGESPKVIP